MTHASEPREERRGFNLALALLIAPDRCRSEPENLKRARLEAAVAIFGQPGETRTRSKRHGYQPRAAQHVRDYFRQALGESARGIARATGRSVSTVHASIVRGRRIVQEVIDRHRHD